MTHYEIADITKVLSTIKALNEHADFIGREFTKKEFDKVFKGIVSLDWLRENGFNESSRGYYEGRVYHKPYRPGKEYHPFVKLVRVEDFEMPYKEDAYVPTTLVAYCVATGETLPKVNAKRIDRQSYSFDKDYFEIVTELFGEIGLREEKPTTFTAHRNFYEFDLDALKSIDKRAESMRAYYERRLEKAQREMEKCLVAIASLD